ncbi:uncharacterized protein [Temnothorax nylanderi]
MTTPRRTVYSDLEKQIFLEILKKYKHVVESKGTNSSTLKDKTEAWSIITEEYNNSSLISTKRDVQQLKKYWSNLKQQSKNILTTERQSRFLTGGGPQKNIGEVDPNVLDIIPNLMTTAPTISSSNFNTHESADRQKEVLKAIQQNSMTKFDHIIDEGLSKGQSLTLPPIEPALNINIVGEEVNNVEIEIDDSISIDKGSSNQSSDIFIIDKENRALIDFKKSKRIDANSCSNPKKQKMERITLVSEKEIELANIKINHEIEMCKLKKQREEFINKITMEKLLLEKKELQERFKLASSVLKKRWEMITFRILISSNKFYMRYIIINNVKLIYYVDYTSCFSFNWFNYF